jgi:hypothetical protein
LCFTGIVYDRRVAGRTLTFGVSGMLWRENLVMYDRETDSWWAQAGGRAIHGPLQGQALAQVAASMTTWKDWLARHPDTLLLSKRTAQGVEGRNDSYAVYHAASDLGVTGRLRRQRSALDPKTKVLGFRLADGAYVTTLSALARAKVIVIRAGRESVVLSASRDGSGGRVFRAADRIFAATVVGGIVELVDAGTGSRWDAFEGRAVSGQLAGASLEEVPSSLAYWFAWHAFLPQTEVLAPPK